jgi:hypothetical protein
MNLARYPAFLEGVDTVQISDDFFWYVTAHQWTSLAADVTPTLTVGDAVNGVLALFTDTTDNNEVAVRSTAELFKFGTGRSIYGRCKLQYSENDTNKANVMFGFQNAIAANSMVDNGAGVRTTGSNAVIYKVDGGTVWRCQTMCNNASTDTVSTTTAGGTDAQVLEIFGNDWDGVSMQFTFKVDGNYLKDSNGNVIRHTVAIASATEMHLGVYVKTGGGAGGETVNVDHICATQTRV